MADVGLGATIQVGATTFSNVTDIAMPELSVQALDVTHLGVSDRTRLFKPGLKEPGSMRFKARYTGAGFAAAVGLVGDESACVVTFPDDATASFNGYISSMPKGNMVADAIVDFEVEIKIQGAITFAA